MQIIFIELVKLHNVAASSGQNSRYKIMQCSKNKNGTKKYPGNYLKLPERLIINSLMTDIF